MNRKIIVSAILGGFFALGCLNFAVADCSSPICSIAHQICDSKYELCTAQLTHAFQDQRDYNNESAKCSNDRDICIKNADEKYSSNSDNNNN